MAIGIIGAMEPEVKSLIEALKDAKTKTIGNITFHSGQLCAQDVVIAQCGIGKASSAAVTALMIVCFEVTAVINTGAAGAIAHDLKIGDTVFSTKAAYHDVDITAFGYKKGQMAAHDLYFDADPQMMAKAEIAASTIAEFSGHIRKGIILSGDVFINSPEAKDRILDDFPSAMVVEMEGAALAQICHDFGVPFIIIRAVSDSATEDDHGVTSDEFLQLASVNSAKLVKALLNLL